MRPDQKLISLVVADDHPVVLEGIAGVLGAERDLRILAQCRTGAGALRAIEELKPAVAVLDIAMPEINGVDVLTRLRANGADTKVILLTAKGEITDKVTGLDYGADDYIAKPFSTEELMARIRAALRRKGEVVPEDALTFGDMELNPTQLKLTVKGKELKLNLKESELLELLVTRKLAVTSKEQIIEKLWGFDSNAESAAA